MSSNQYFNPIPLFILFREAIEASIVVAVLLTFLSRASPSLKKHGEVHDVHTACGEARTTAAAPSGAWKHVVCSRRSCL